MQLVYRQKVGNVATFAKHSMHEKLNMQKVLSLIDV